MPCNLSPEPQTLDGFENQPIGSPLDDELGVFALLCGNLDLHPQTDARFDDEMGPFDLGPKAQNADSPFQGLFHGSRACFTVPGVWLTVPSPISRTPFLAWRV